MPRIILIVAPNIEFISACIEVWFWYFIDIRLAWISVVVVVSPKLPKMDVSFNSTSKVAILKANLVAQTTNDHAKYVLERIIYRFDTLITTAVL